MTQHKEFNVNRKQLQKMRVLSSVVLGIFILTSLGLVFLIDKYTEIIYSDAFYIIGIVSIFGGVLTMLRQSGSSMGNYKGRAVNLFGTRAGVNRFDKVEKPNNHSHNIWDVHEKTNVEYQPEISYWLLCILSGVINLLIAIVLTIF